MMDISAIMADVLGTLLDCPGDRYAACCLRSRVEKFEVLRKRKYEFFTWDSRV